MVTRIQKSSSTVSGILNYNEGKVALGVATPVCLRNTPYDNDPPEESPLAALYGIFDDLENLPTLSVKMRSPSFQMTVNPSESDDIRLSEQSVLQYIDEVMNRLGYGEQPYIVYRHNDIEREHWHVVSTKIKPDGTIIHNNFEGYQLSKIQAELAPKYGFIPGKDSGKEQSEEYDEMLNMEGHGYPVFDQKVRNKKKLVRSIFETAMSFLFRSFEAFQRIMASMSVKVIVSTKKGESHLIMHGLKDGKTSSGVDIQDAELYANGYAMVMERIETNKKLPIQTIQEDEASQKIQLASDFVLKHSSSLDEYVSKMDSIGLVVSANRTSVDGIVDVTVISRRMRTILDSENGTFDVAPFNHAEQTGQWMAPHRGRKPKMSESAKTLSAQQTDELKKLLRDLNGVAKRPKQKTAEKTPFSPTVKR